MHTMDLGEIAESDLAALLEFFRLSANGGNRLFLDLFTIIEREMLSRYETTALADYPDQTLMDALARLATLIDEQRAAGMKDDYPALRFLLLNVTAIVTEWERREKRQPLQ